MHWVVDNAGFFYFALAVLAAALFAVFWVNRRVVYLAASLGVLGLLFLFWLLTQLVVSDRKQIDRNLHVMALAVVDRDTDRLFKYVAKDFRYGQMDRDTLYSRVQQAIKLHNVRDIRISEFEAQELSPSAGTAKVSFKAAIHSPDHIELLLFRANFVREADVWKIQSMQAYNPFVNTDQPMNVLP